MDSETFTETALWDPFTALRELLSKHEVVFDDEIEPGEEHAFIEHYANGMWRVVIDSNLTPREQRCALAHELVHLERGRAIANWVPGVLADLEEIQVEMDTASRLVPPSALALWCSRTVAEGGAVTMVSIADAFDVIESVAATAYQMMLSPWISGYGMLRALHRHAMLPPIPSIERVVIQVGPDSEFAPLRIVRDDEA